MFSLGSGITVSYGPQSVIVQFTVRARVIVAGTGLYTVPAGQKAKAKGSMNLDAVGADATYAIATLRAGTYIPVGEHVAVNGISRADEVELDAGDILTNIGDAGSTNGTCDMNASIQELPA